MFICLLNFYTLRKENTNALINSKITLQNNLKEDLLPAIEMTDVNIFSPPSGTSLEKSKELLIKYFSDQNIANYFSSDLATSYNPIFQEITIKEAWDNLGTQIYRVNNGIAVIKDDKILCFLDGMPAYNVFLADLDKDGYYEIYANIAFGSGIVSMDIRGYNIASNSEYYLSKRMDKDLNIFIQDNTLWVKESPSMGKAGDTIITGKLGIKTSDNKSQLFIETIKNNSMQDNFTRSDDLLLETPIDKIFIQSINEKLSNIANPNDSKLLLSSNPYDYIKNNYKDYNYIVSNGEKSLNYMLNRFANSISNGLEEYIMATACSEILNEDKQEKNWASGREWYNNYVVKTNNQILKLNKNTIPNFAIYIVKNSDGSMIKNSDMGELDDKNLSKMFLDTEPILTDEDLIAYHWKNTPNKDSDKQTHIADKYIDLLELKDMKTLRERMDKKGYGDTRHLPFVAVANGERIYLGFFNSLLSSWSPPENIHIRIDLLQYDKTSYRLNIEDTFINWAHDNRIYDTLGKSGKLKIS